jgi:hypothetical protein
MKLRKTMETLTDSALPATGGALLVSILMMLWNKFKPAIPAIPGVPTIPTPSVPTPSPATSWLTILLDLFKQIANKQAVSSNTVDAVVSVNPPQSIQELIDQMTKLIQAPSDPIHVGNDTADLVRCAQAVKERYPENDITVTITENAFDVSNKARVKKGTTDASK